MRERWCGVVKLVKKQCKSGRDSYWQNGKVGICVKSKESKCQNVLTNEPWPCEKSVVNKAHELKSPVASSTSTSVAGALLFS